MASTTIILATILTITTNYMIVLTLTLNYKDFNTNNVIIIISELSIMTSALTTVRTN